MTADSMSRIRTARYVAGYAGVACASVYLVLKALWIAGVPIGLSSGVLDGDSMLAGNLLTAGLAAVGVLVLLAFTHGWGRRVPAWLLLVPTWVGTGILAPIAVMMVVLPLLAVAGVYSWPVVDEAAPWLHPLVYSCFTGLGVALAIVFGLHVRERWPALFRPTRPLVSPTYGIQRPLAWAGILIAAFLGLLRLYWAAGGTAGLLTANLDRRELPWHLLQTFHGALTLAAVASMGVLLYRPERRLLVALPTLWIGSGALFATGLIELGLGLTSGPVTAWENPETQAAYNGMNFGALLAGIALGFAALLAAADRVYSSRWTVAGENAGTHTATYSAPGVE